MKVLKKMKYLIAVSALSTSLFASESMYVGVGGLVGTGTQTLTYMGDSYSADYTTSGGSAKIGWITKSENRFELSVSSFKLSGDNGGSDKYTGLDFDYLWVFSTKSKFKPYLGLGFGYYSSAEMTGYNEDTGEEEHANAVGLNLNAGLLYEVAPSWELELGYKYKRLTWDYAEFDLKDDINNIYAGVNFKF